MGVGTSNWYAPRKNMLTRRHVARKKKAMERPEERYESGLLKYRHRMKILPSSSSLRVIEFKHRILF